MKNLTRISAAIIAANCSAIAMHSQVATAQEQLILEEVVVTARKRAESLQEVPIAITAFTENTIDRAGIERPQDFIGLTPNVTIVDSANAGDTQVTIRGITSTRDAEGTFAYVVDGVLVTNPNGFNQELFDVQQIEVLKGPQGATYGRNAVSGAIIVTTKKPSEEFEGYVKAGMGSDSLVKGSAVVSGPLTENLSGRIALSQRESDGQFTNEYTGQDDVVDFFEDQSIRGRLIWDASDVLSFDLQGSYSKVESGAINFNAIFALPDAAANFGSPDLYKNVNDHDFRFLFNVPGENEQETSSLSLKADYEMDNSIITAVFAYDNLEEYLLSDGTSAAFGLYSYDFGAAAGPGSALTGPTVGQAQNACSQSYNENIGSLNEQAPFYAIPGDPEGPPVVPGMAFDFGIAPVYGLNALLPPYTQTTCDGYQYQQRDQESTSFEIRIASKDTDQLSWMGGFYYAQIDREVAVSYGADLGDGFFGRKPYVEGRTDLAFWDDFSTDVIALFGSLDYDINDQHSVSLAARYDEEDRDVSNKVPNVPSSNNFGGGAPINPAYDGSFTDSIPDRSEEFSQFQPKLSWTWTPVDEASIYASYGVGFRSGGFNSLGSAALVQNEFGSLGTQPQNLRDEYDKEVSTSFELGAKTEWLDNRLRVNAAVFHTEVEDSQFFNFLAGGFGILRVVTNIDEVTLQGAEVDFEYLLTQSFSFYGSVGITDSEIDKNDNRPYTEGNEMPLTPDMTGNLGFQWVGEVMQDVDMFVRLDWQYIGETWFSTVQDNVTNNGFTDVSGLYQGIGQAFGDVTQTPAGPGIPAGGILGFGQSNYDKGQRDAYDLLNVRVGIEGEAWSVTFWGDNILDEDYLEEIIPAPEFGGYFVHPAKGESYGLDVVYRF